MLVVSFFRTSIPVAPNGVVQLPNLGQINYLKSAEDEKAAVRAVLDILRNVKGDSPAAETARDAYEFITGEEFRGDGAALLWISRQSSPSQD